MCRLYGEPEKPELGDYWATSSGWAAYLPGGVVELQEHEVREGHGTLSITAESLVQQYGRVLPVPKRL